MSNASKINLASFDDLFGNDNKQDVKDILITEIHPFRDHPFKVERNEDMDKLIESIELHGRVLEPCIVRKRRIGGYELISGHRRCYASKILGYEKLPCIVRDLTDDEATVMMVDSNIHREKLPSK